MRTENVDASFSSSSARPESFHHEAFLHRGDRGFLEGTVPFVRAAVDAHEPVLVAVSAERIDLLRHALDGHHRGVRFADMADLGRNPRCIIPAWTEFLDRHAGGRPARGIGEPIWSGRSSEELEEFHQHESLLNLAFASADSFWLLCPYDTAALPPHVVDCALVTHPHTFDGRHRRPSDRYIGAHGRLPEQALLSEPPAHADQITFDGSGLGPVRDLVAGLAERAGMARDRIDDLNLAVNEIATNSVRHGGGKGILRMWAEPTRVVCQVNDGGHIRDPLAGRALPPADRPSGRGMWMANHLCDLVQVRSSEAGTAIRLQMMLR